MSPQTPPLRASTPRQPLAARLITVGGRVQGVGFRPFVYGLALRHGLAGTVRNIAGEVEIVAEGSPDQLASFEAALVAEAPTLARPRLARSTPAAVAGHRGFEIARSRDGIGHDVHLPPDLDLCADCRAELFDPSNRRYRHPFITCTQCGPRYTLIRALPYDRAATSMAGFPLCPSCRGEYEDPAQRRFHAEPLCCPDCGPSLAFVRPGDARIAGTGPALTAALDVLRSGGILAVKGVGGYHLMCDAASDAAIATLRVRKRRPSKPLAVMFPPRGADGLAAIRQSVVIDDATAVALADPIRPIVLAARREDCPLSALLAPGLGDLGVFLPYAPLHHLLLSDFGAPLVATSGNVSGEPVLTDPTEAERRLGSVADAFLHHDRPIVRPADDTVLRVIAGRARPIRIGRGAGPLELALPIPLPAPAIALGGHMKAAIAIGIGDRAILAPHIGDLDSPRALDLLARLTTELADLHRAPAEMLVADAHQGYASTRWAARQALPVAHVPHHAAHASALAAEHPDIQSWLTFAWDGVGLGEDGTLWGGEALLGRPGAWHRVASFRPFRLPGGDLAARAPWRSAAALMWEAGRAFAPDVRGLDLARQAWDAGVNSASTSSAGRLFDAAAALVIGMTDASFEGEGAMQLEALATRAARSPAAPLAMPLAADADGVLRTDWSALLAMLTDTTLDPGTRARHFHTALAAALVRQAEHVTRTFARPGGAAPYAAIGLTGGVFQNKLLAEDVLQQLGHLGYAVHLPTLAPMTDGGLAYGQLVEAAARTAHEDRP